MTVILCASTLKDRLEIWLNYLCSGQHHFQLHVRLVYTYKILLKRNNNNFLPILVRAGIRFCLHKTLSTHKELKNLAKEQIF